MPYTVEVVSGPAAGRQFNILSERPTTFGRSMRAQFAIPEDSHLSSVHFSLERSGDAYTLCDLGSTNGTYLTDDRLLKSPIAAGMVFSAGNSTFRVLAAPADEWPGFPPDKKELCRQSTAREILYSRFLTRLATIVFLRFWLPLRPTICLCTRARRPKN